MQSDSGGRDPRPMSEETRKSSPVRRTFSAALSAVLIAILGMGAIAPETARAAGVVVEHRAYGAPDSTPARED
jgi:hypothetical protein